MSVEIISCTTIAWDKFTAACVKEFGRSPTRELDSKNISVGDILSFAYAFEVLSGNKDAVGSPVKLQRSLDFIHVTFVISFDDYDQFPAFCNLAPMSILQFQNKNKGFGLFNGSLRDLRALIIRGSHKDQMEEIRKTCNLLYQNLEMLGFGGLCGSKEHLIDKTYALKG